MEQKIQIELTINETNMILRVLGKHPFDEVVDLIQKIKTQGEAQLAAMSASPETTDKA